MILETARGDSFASIPDNYLVDYCRRVAGLDNIANFFVEERLDSDTGLVYFHLRQREAAPALNPDVVELPTNMDNSPAVGFTRSV